MTVMVGPVQVLLLGLKQVLVQGDDPYILFRAFVVHDKIVSIVSLQLEALFLYLITECHHRLPGSIAMVVYL